MKSGRVLPSRQTRYTRWVGVVGCSQFTIMGCREFRIFEFPTFVAKNDITSSLFFYHCIRGYTVDPIIRVFHAITNLVSASLLDDECLLYSTMVIDGWWA